MMRASGRLVLGGSTPLIAGSGRVPESNPEFNQIGICYPMLLCFITFKIALQWGLTVYLSRLMKAEKI